MGKLIAGLDFYSKGGISYLYHKRLEIKFWKYFQEENWSKAIKTGNSAANYFPGNKMLHIRLAECWQHIGERKTAFDILEKSMKLNFSLAECVGILEQELSEEGYRLTSSYVFLGGKKNFGFFEHKLSNKDKKKEYLTKIVSSDDSRELLFYKYIYPAVKNITPKLIHLHSLHSTNIHLITIKKINSEKPAFNRKLLKEVIKNNLTVASVDYRSVVDWLPYPDSEGYILIDENSPNIPLQALKSFVFIDKESANKQLFHQMRTRMNKHEYSEQSLKLVDRLEAIVLTHKVYEKINPVIHYSIQHGDLTLDNMVIDKGIGKLFFIDWGHMRMGPRVTDMAGFLGLAKVPFNYIDNHYISKTSGTLDHIDRVLFLYALIVTWFIVLSKEQFEKGQSIYVDPALEKLEKLTWEIVNNPINTKNCKSSDMPDSG